MSGTFLGFTTLRGLPTSLNFILVSAETAMRSMSPVDSLRAETVYGARREVFLAAVAVYAGMFW